MITLGLRKIGLKRPEPSAPVIRALTETVAWCLSRSQEPDGLRSRELNPAASLEVPPFGEYPLDIWVAKKRESYLQATRTITAMRSALIRDGGLEIPALASAQSQGRLLLYEPLETVDDGAATVSSKGFFNFEDAPPWDTWIVYSGGSIFCWVPNSLVLNAQAGIDANPVDCIHWRDWSMLSEPQDV
jgi:hypothetical protein